ncbi:MAG: 30S ribosomal protein S4 [Halobacteriales archaeon]
MALGTNTKLYETPNHPYQGGRIAEEHDLVGRYGLKNKEELWRAQSELRSIRREARDLLAQFEAEEEADAFLDRLVRYGILGENDGLGDVLALDETDLLERRLQTVVYRQGLANTIDQARQFVTHGHVVVGDRRVQAPGYTLEVEEEDDIAFDQHSPLADELHPERADEQ